MNVDFPAPGGPEIPTRKDGRTAAAAEAGGKGEVGRNGGYRAPGGLLLLWGYHRAGEKLTHRGTNGL